MPRLNAANRAKSTLASSITSSATSMTVADASLFPDAPFCVTLENEIIEVGAINRSTKVLSQLLRGEEGTTAASHALGVQVLHRFTAGMFNDLRTYIDEAEAGDYAGVKYRLVMIDGEAYMEVVDNA